MLPVVVATPILGSSLQQLAELHFFVTPTAASGPHLRNLQAVDSSGTSPQRFLFEGYQAHSSALRHAFPPTRPPAKWTRERVVAVPSAQQRVSQQVRNSLWRRGHSWKRSLSLQPVLHVRSQPASPSLHDPPVAPALHQAVRRTLQARTSACELQRAPPRVHLLMPLQQPPAALFVHLLGSMQQFVPPRPPAGTSRSSFQPTPRELVQAAVPASYSLP
mmetsp:Transcript_46622/g.108667  ORF Transcript_46622/g.108667 Transcript_46622/m.108667 type:complete len:218 (+) Transcript_46622:210-863(+)